MENVLTLIFTALVIPFLTAFFNKENWNGDKKFIVSLLVTIVFGGITQFAAVKAGWQAQDGDAILRALGLIFTGAQGFFRLFPNAVSHVEKNINGVVKTPDVGDLVNNAIAAATPLIVEQIEKKFGEKVKGSAPSEPQAQFGGPTIPTNPVAATAYNAAPAPTITPAPSVQAQVDAVANAIDAGTSIQQVVDNYDPIAG